jgi:hypothetical protein
MDPHPSYAYKTRNRGMGFRKPGHSLHSSFGYSFCRTVGAAGALKNFVQNLVAIGSKLV